MRVGLVIANNGPEAISNVRTWPAAAEEMGFDSIWFTDHVIGTKSYTSHFGAGWSEALTSLAFAAARTTTIRLGVGVLVVPYRNPVYSARVLATIDLLSDGRLDVGVGVGWSRTEYRALGVGAAFDERGARADEALDVMVACWAGGPVDFDGRWSQIHGIESLPAPSQVGGPPLWVGGASRRALRRAARFGAAWHPSGIPAEEIARLGQELDVLAGRPVRRTARTKLDATAGPGHIRDVLAAFAGAGCTDLAVDVVADDTGALLQCVERLAAVPRPVSALTNERTPG